MLKLFKAVTSPLSIKGITLFVKRTFLLLKLEKQHFRKKQMLPPSTKQEF
jgi:hypothetical protein